MSYEKRREKELKKFVHECRTDLEQEVHEVFLQKQEYSHRGGLVPEENIRVKSEMKRDIAESYMGVEGYRRRNRNWLRQSYLNKK